MSNFQNGWPATPEEEQSQVRLLYGVLKHSNQTEDFLRLTQRLPGNEWVTTLHEMFDFESGCWVTNNQRIPFMMQESNLEIVRNELEFFRRLKAAHGQITATMPHQSADLSSI